MICGHEAFPIAGIVAIWVCADLHVLSYFACLKKTSSPRLRYTFIDAIFGLTPDDAALDAAAMLAADIIAACHIFLHLPPCPRYFPAADILIDFAPPHVSHTALTLVDDGAPYGQYHRHISKDWL